MRDILFKNEVIRQKEIKNKKNSVQKLAMSVAMGSSKLQAVSFKQKRSMFGYTFPFELTLT